MFRQGIARWPLEENGELCEDNDVPIGEFPTSNARFPAGAVSGHSAQMKRQGRRSPEDWW